MLAPFRPESLSLDAWLMFAIFVGTIIGCITQPMPIGAVSIIGFTLTVLVGVIDTKTAVQGFGNPSIWLIAMAFFISRGFVKTGLGRRIALQFVRLFGKKTLGLAYSLVGVDLILAPEHLVILLAQVELCFQSFNRSLNHLILIRNKAPSVRWGHFNLY